MNITLKDVMAEIRDFRAENAQAHEKLNGRVTLIEIAAAVNQTDIANLEEKVHALSIIDKAVALAAGVAAAITGVLVSK